MSILCTVLRAVDCSWRKCLCLSLLLVCGIQKLYCREKSETPQQTNDRIQQLAIKARTRPANIPIGGGDLLHIEVFDVPDLTRDVRVSQTGEISLPLVPGVVAAAGLTPFELQEKIANLLQENGLVSHPQVSVFVKEQTSQPVSVIGAVKTSQIIQAVRPMTLLEVLAQAGGIADDAGSVVLVTRSTAVTPSPPPQLPESHGQRSPAANAGDSDPAVAENPPESHTITLKLRDLLESGDPAFNIPVYGGDVVSVPRSGIVYVAGAVQSPGGYVLQDRGEQITTLKAIALAHGLKSTAKANNAVIVRANPQTGKKEEIPVHLKTIMARRTEDVRLYPNDLLFVPDSAGKKALYRTGEAAIAVGSGLAIVRSGSL